jgi:hypothetical protein
MKKTIAFAGLGDVVGGRLWYCVEPTFRETVWFGTKKECEAYIRKNFTGHIKKEILGQLWSVKGRAIIYT